MARINSKTTPVEVAAAILVRAWGNRGPGEAEFRERIAKRDETKAYYRKVAAAARRLVKDGARPAAPADGEVEPGKRHPAQIKLDGLRKRVRKIAAKMAEHAGAPSAVDPDFWKLMTQSLTDAASPKAARED